MTDGSDEKPPQGSELPEPAAFELPEEFKTDETAQLVLRAQEGDSDALNELFTRHHAMMLEMARRELGPKLRGKIEADDLAQTTFREAARDFGRYQYRGEGSLLRWLVQILQNKIRDKAEFYSAGKRDMSRERNMESDSSDSGGDSGRRYEPPAEDLSVTRQVQRNEEFAIVREALDRLSDEHRRAITLVFFQGLSLREAGEQMDGRSEDAVRMLLRRAEAKLHEITKARLG